MTKNHFATLGLKPGASEDEIKKSYRTLAKKFHPDKNKEAGAEEKFKEISAAYDYLKSQDRRFLLECDLKKEKEAPKKTASGDGFSAYFKAKGDKSSNNTSYGQDDTAYSSKYKGTSFSKRFGDEDGEDNYTWSKKEKKGTKKKKKPKPWNSDWNSPEDTFRSEGRHPSFSFAFRTFVDDLDSNFSMFFSASGPFEFSAFYGDDSDPFAEFFSASGGTSTFSRKKPPKEKKRHVAEEHGYREGLDEEYLFSPRQGQSRGDVYDSDTEDDEPGFRFSMSESDEDDYEETRFKCAFCGKRLKLEALKTHEPSCGRRKKKEVNLDSDDEIDPNGYTARFFSKPTKIPGDWRGTHEELLHHIRRQRRAAKAQQSARDSDLETINCKWCGRSFSRKAAETHIPFCEKWVRDHGRPMSPSFPHNQKSKTEKAKEYAKRVPKPRGFKVHVNTDSYSSPRDFQSPREKGSKSGEPCATSFPDINDAAKTRQTTDKPYPSTTTGLNPSTTPRSTAHSTPRSTPHFFKKDGYKSEVGGSGRKSNSRTPNNRTPSNRTPSDGISSNHTPRFKHTDNTKYSRGKGETSFGISGSSYGGGLKGTGLSGIRATGTKVKGSSHHVKFADTS